MKIVHESINSEKISLLSQVILNVILTCPTPSSHLLQQWNIFKLHGDGLKVGFWFLTNHLSLLCHVNLLFQ